MQGFLFLFLDLIQICSLCFSSLNSFSFPGSQLHSNTNISIFFCSLSDRRPVEKDDEVVVMLVPDYQMLEYVERIASQLSDDPVCESIEITGTTCFLFLFHFYCFCVMIHASCKICKMIGVFPF